MVTSHLPGLSCRYEYVFRASFRWRFLLLSPVIGGQSSEVMFPRHLLCWFTGDEIIFPSCAASTYWLEQVFAHARFLMSLQCVRGGVTLWRCGCSKDLNGDLSSGILSGCYATKASKSKGRRSSSATIPGKYHLSANVTFSTFSPPPFSQLLTGTLDGKLRLFQPSSGALLTRDAGAVPHWAASFHLAAAETIWVSFKQHGVSFCLIWHPVTHTHTHAALLWLSLVKAPIFFTVKGDHHDVPQHYTPEDVVSQRQMLRNMTCDVRIVLSLTPSASFYSPDDSALILFVLSVE